MSYKIYDMKHKLSVALVIGDNDFIYLLGKGENTSGYSLRHNEELTKLLYETEDFKEFIHKILDYQKSFRLNFENNRKNLLNVFSYDTEIQLVKFDLGLYHTDMFLLLMDKDEDYIVAISPGKILQEVNLINVGGSGLTRLNKDLPLDTLIEEVIKDYKANRILEDI